MSAVRGKFRPLQVTRTEVNLGRILLTYRVDKCIETSGQKFAVFLEAKTRDELNNSGRG